MQRILVIQTAFIGDVVLATGLLEKLHACYPQCKLDILVRKGNHTLFKDHPYLHEVLIWDKSTAKYRSLFQLLKHIRRTRYDLVVNVQRYLATGFLTGFSAAAKTIGFKTNPLSFLFTTAIKHSFTENVHEVERNHSLIAAITDEQYAKPRLYPSATDRHAVVNHQQGSYICVAPASVWYTKQLPADQWVALVKALPEQDHVFLLGAPGDHALCEEIRVQSARERVTNLAGSLPILASAALMENARMNYVNDSGPMHFASAMNAPVTAVYCSTIPGFGYGPLSDNSTIVETPEPLSCRPCGLHGYKVCPQAHFKCATTISTQQLLNSIH